MEGKLKQLDEKLTNHIQEYEDKMAQLAEIDLQLMKAQNRNTESIADLTAATQGLVDAWTAANAFQKFLKWIGSFAVIGAALSYLGLNADSLFK